MVKKRRPTKSIWNGEVRRETKVKIKFHFKTDDKFEIYRKNFSNKGSYNKWRWTAINLWDECFISNQELIVMRIKRIDESWF